MLLVAVAMAWQSPPAQPRGSVSAETGVPASGSAPSGAQLPGALNLQPAADSPQEAPSASGAPDPAAGTTRPEVLGVSLPTAPEPLSLLTGYVWPIAHPRLTLPFGPTSWGTRIVDGRLFHDGVDLATFCGDRIVAAHDGVVLAAGRHFDNYIGWVGDLTAYYKLLDAKQMWNDLPNVVIIDDGNTYRSVYAHFSRVVVHVGEHVRAGQLIGYEGMTGHATGCHLHYGIFSPLETATFGIEPSVAKSLRLPTKEIARVDPLLVLPYRAGISGPTENLGSG